MSLASRGTDVIVLEHGDSPGGKVRSTQTPLGGVDRGPTVLTLKWVFDELFDAAGLSLDNALNVSQLEVLAHHRWPDGSRLDLFADIRESESAIRALAGDESAREYIRFCQQTSELLRVLLPAYMMSADPAMAGTFRRAGIGGMITMARARPFDSLWKGLGKIFTDDRLRQLFSRYATYCGSSPFLAPATLMLIAQVEQRGVWSVEGGMVELARAMEKAAQACGAQFRYGLKATGLKFSKGRVTGVITGDEELIQADHVIVTTDLEALAGGSLGPELKARIPGRSSVDHSLSAITWSGLARLEGDGLDYHNVIFSGDYPAEFRALFKRSEMPAQPTAYLCAPDRARPQKTDPACETERIFLLINAPPVPEDGDSRAMFKESLNREAVSSVLSSGEISIDWDSARLEYTTPIDFDARFPGSRGALYGGATHGWKSAFTRQGVDSGIPGVWFAGGGVHPGPGVPMVALSGRAAAEKVWKSIEKAAGRRRGRASHA